MKFLMTNDDGWGFPGIQCLERIARNFGEVWVVAPMHPMSGISHQMTFEVPMTFEERETNSYALEGTPADCVRVAIAHLDVEFDWVLSGINKGANLGSDLNVSGTVAAAREASHLGLKGVAVSQHLKKFNEPFDWSIAETQACRVLEKILSNEEDTPPSSWLNVNLPDVGEDAAPIRETVLDNNPLPSRYEVTPDGKLLYCGKYKDRRRDQDRDVQLCFDGHITITKHQLK